MFRISDHDGELVKQDQKDLEELLRKKLESLTGEKPVNFQRIQIKINSEEIIASATFRDFENPRMYFFASDDVTVEEKPDDVVFTDKQTIEKCAVESLRNEKSAGFQFCDLENEKYCQMITPSDPNGKLTVRRTDEKCETNLKVSNEKFEYATFDEKVARINAAVKAGEFVVEHLAHPFNFTKIHFTREQADIDQSRLFELKARGRTLTAEAIKKTLSAENGIHTLTNCFQACRDARKSNFTCDHFSYCKRLDGRYDCHLGSFIDRNEADSVKKVKVKSETSEEIGEDLTKEDENCFLYSVSSLDMFVEHPERRFVEEGVKVVDVIENIKTTSARCAQHCLDYSGDHSADENRCLSFEICKNAGKATCRLSSTVTRWDNGRLDPDIDCSVYSANHLLNFYPTAKRRLQNFRIEPALSADHCATKCDLSDCEVFNYCETDRLVRKIISSFRPYN